MQRAGSLDKRYMESLYSLFPLQEAELLTLKRDCLCSTAPELLFSALRTVLLTLG